jgi:hypothetical protein
VTERDNRLREIELGAARGLSPNADVHVESTGASSSGNFAALSNFAVGGTKAENVSGPYTVTGEYAGLKGPPTREPLNQPVQSSQSSHNHHPQATPINMPARLSDLAASSGSAPGMGGGGYALPVNMMTPRYGTHGGSPGAPPTSGAGNPLVNMNAIHVLCCAICNAMCNNPDHHRQMREAGATAGLNPQPPGACPPPRAAAAGSPGGGGDPYLHGLGATELPDSYRRMGNEIYWTIRRTARSIVEYLERTYPGDKQDAGYFHLLTLGAERRHDIGTPVQTVWSPGRVRCSCVRQHGGGVAQHHRSHLPRALAW